ALEIGRNIIHGSDAVDNAQKEIDLFFSPNEIMSYDRAVDPWIFE
ncbi:MAG: nucleoside-diphosphate kinase, partial [Dehalococcoidia bacterium]|nr:nucleoside-diphosphate kinase [Dehalococcoidia bacterium]